MKTHSTFTASNTVLTKGNQLRKINVLYVIGSLPLGGAENQVVTLATALSNDRYTIHVCCLRQAGVLANRLRAKGIQVVSLNMRLRYWPVAVYQLYRFIHRLKPEIVHTHMYEAGVWGGMVGKLAGVPVIIATEHSIATIKKHMKLIEMLINHFATIRTAVSEEIRQCFIDSKLGSPEKIITIPNTVDVAHFEGLNHRYELRDQLGVNASTPLIGTVARLVQPKRIDLLLEAAQTVSALMPQACFLVIGDGPLGEQLQRQAVQLGLTPKCVRFLGSRQDIPDLLSAIDIFVLSSEMEGLPVALLEAMAASKPIIATQVGAIPQVIQNGRNGILVASHDTVSLANAIIGLIQDSTLCESLAREAHRTVEERFSTRVVCQQIIALYDYELMKKKRSYLP